MAQESDTLRTKYEERVERYKSSWDKVIPRYIKLQYAGSMGLLSVGTGWNYYRDHWETDVLLGFIPAYADDNMKRQNRTISRGNCR